MITKRPSVTRPETARRVVALPARQPEPPHVHRDGVVAQREARQVAHAGAAPVAGDDEVGGEVVLGLPGILGPVAPPHPGDPAAAPAQVRHLGVAQQRERRLLLGGRGEHVEQVPLRDHRDERVPDGEPREVGDRRRARVEDDPRLLDRLPRQLGEAVPQAQLVDQRHRRDVDGVAAEVPQEVAVLLQHGDLDPGPREHQSQHDPGGPAADDRARRPLLCHGDPPRSARGQHARTGRTERRSAHTLRSASTRLSQE